jgi:stringent starvation protein B|tara:strand:+ start:1215 stop:1595 length:381 start_codon:yes stop_codon:yes gene_type:complete
MTSQKPYLIRAVYEWLIDNGATPYLLVDTSFEGVIVPEAFINDSKIVLNIAPDAVQHYEVNNENIYFSARFSGKRMELFIPIEAVLSIYGKENNQGMFFSEEQTSPPTPPSNSTKEKGKPKLMIVK